MRLPRVASRTPIRALVLTLALALLSAACGAATSSTSQPGASATVSTATPGTTASEAPAASAVPTPSATAADLGDWPVYHLDAERTGYSQAFPAFKGSPSAAWSTPLDGAVYGQPLVVHGRVIAATEGDSVYALDPASGATVWRRNLGTPVRLSSLPCGDIDPLGITGTPAYDPATNSLFAVAEVTGPHHVLFALNADSGTVLWSRDVDLPGQDPTTHQQRPALAVANGYVYIGFGGLAGDCGQYKGKIVGVPTSGQGATISYVVPVAREGAVWATGGPAIDAAGDLYVSTGNGSSTSTYDGSDSVVQLSPTLQLVSRFAPASWAQDNASDADLGSTSPMLLPGGWVFIVGKSGTAYVLRQGALGGIGGQVASAYVCGSFGAAARNGNTVFVPCEHGLREIQVMTDGTIAVGWKTSTGAGAPPVVGGGAVWSCNIDNGTLFALDPTTGATLASLAVGNLPHFASPTLWQGRVFIGTLAGVAAVNA
ncbi:MAG TPA: PQQ-binding-like beta-propeller repeat protein [Candidatus Limnocylindrales bacterium]|nr:PQQ-binding-like beta-propeller repeat protein [Candidatus Limnocylindrales bacterium]